MLGCQGKKVPPPTSDGREGRLFPPEHFAKLSGFVCEVETKRNKILQKLVRLMQN